MATENTREDQQVSKGYVKNSQSDSQQALWNYLTEGSLDHVEMELVSKMLEKWREMGIEKVQAGHAIHGDIEVFGSKLESATTDILCASDVNPGFARLVLAKTHNLFRRKSNWNLKASHQGAATTPRKLPKAELMMA